MLEILLGIDNIVFIVILGGKLDPATQEKARRLGLLAAMFSRVFLLLTPAWIMRSSQPLFQVFGRKIGTLLFFCVPILLPALITHLRQSSPHAPQPY
jgi:predicted tellurium resistance membrane protein TerC